MTGGEGGDDRQKQKDKTLDPRLLMSRMTEWGGGGDDRKRKASRMTEGKNGDDGGKELLDEAA